MRSDSLSLAALKYAAGDLAPLDADAFELRLADDADARDALAEAVRLSSAAVGQPDPMPDPLFRDAVIERLRPSQSWVATLLVRRPYRGHPLTWTMTGAGTTACAAFGLWLATPSPEPATNYPINQTIAINHPPQPMPLAVPGKADVRNTSATSTRDTTDTTSIGGTEGDLKAGRPATFLPEPPMGGNNPFDHGS